MEQAKTSVLQSIGYVFTMAVTSERYAEAEDLLQTMRLVGSPAVDWDGFQAAIEMKRGNWTEAARLFRGCPSIVDRWPFGRAVLAACLFQTGDPEWRLHAHAALESDLPPESAARTLVAKLFERVGEIGHHGSLQPSIPPTIDASPELAPPTFMRA